MMVSTVILHELPRALNNLMPRHSLLTLLEYFLDNSLALKA